MREAPSPIKPAGHSASMAHRDRAADGIDLFPTPPWGARAGGEILRQLLPDARSLWEPACGAGHMAHGLGDYFAEVAASDRYAWRVKPRAGASDWRAGALWDFLGGPGMGPAPKADVIVTNPPFSAAEAFVQAALERARMGVAMLCRLAWLESEGREQLLYGAKGCTVMAPFVERVPMHRNRWLPDGSTAGAYAWFVWLQPWMRRPAWCSPWGMQVVPILKGARRRLSTERDLAFAGWVERDVEREAAETAMRRAA